MDIIYTTILFDHVQEIYRNPEFFRVSWSSRDSILKLKGAQESFPGVSISPAYVAG